MRKIEPSTAEAVMAVFGGMPGTRRMVAEALGQPVSQQRVQAWKVKGRFPANTYTLFKVALKEKGLTAPASLWGQVAETEAAE